MAIEKYVAATSLGLFIMFSAEINSLYIFLINPIEDIEPNSYVLQFISIGVAPAVILAAVSFLMSKRYGSKIVGSMIIAGGVAMLIGMYYANSLLDQIDAEYLASAVTLTPPLFMVISIPVIICGVLLLKIKTKRPRKEYF
jgi:hypothetical protein